MSSRRHKRLTSTGAEPDGIVAVLGVLPKLDVAMIEDVLVGVRVVEGLGGQHHAHIVSSIKQWQRLQEEVSIRHLRHEMFKSEKVPEHLPQRGLVGGRQTVKVSQ